MCSLVTQTEFICSICWLGGDIYGEVFPRVWSRKQLFLTVYWQKAGRIICLLMFSRCWKFILCSHNLEQKIKMFFSKTLCLMFVPKKDYKRFFSSSFNFYNNRMSVFQFLISFQENLINLKFFLFPSFSTFCIGNPICSDTIGIIFDPLHLLNQKYLRTSTCPCDEVAVEYQYQYSDPAP